MTIEDIIRKVIREELVAFKLCPHGGFTASAEELAEYTKDVPKFTPEPEPEEMSDFFEESDTPEVTNTTELLEYLKANCTPVQAKRSKDVVVKMGYERVSIVPNDKVQEVLAAILLEVFN